MSGKAKACMFVILNLCMALAMSITADLLHGGLSPRTLLMTLIGFAVGMVLSYLIPFGGIGNALCRAVHCNRQSFPGALLAGIVPALVNTVVIAAVMTWINVPPLTVGWQGYGQAYASVLPWLIPVAYLVGTAVEPLSVRAAIAVDKRTTKNRREE